MRVLFILMPPLFFSHPVCHVAKILFSNGFCAWLLVEKPRGTECLDMSCVCCNFAIPVCGDCMENVNLAILVNLKNRFPGKLQWQSNINKMLLWPKYPFDSITTVRCELSGMKANPSEKWVAKWNLIDFFIIKTRGKSHEFWFIPPPLPPYQCFLLHWNSSL